MSLSTTGRLIRTAFTPRAVPQHLSLPDGICIVHDVHGVPRISAPDPLKCAFGQGYVAALHRLWSMEQQRRVAFARLSEIAGPTTLDIDRWICRLGIKEAIEASYHRIQQNQDAMTLLAAYSEGINHFIRSTDDWGLEFDLLGVRPELWTPKDSVAILSLISFSLAGNWEEQLVRVNTLAALGPEQAACLEADAWSYLWNDASYQKRLAAGITKAFTTFGKLTELLVTYQEVKQQAGLLPRRSGSNAWIVDGKYTDTGKPILAADPHMPLTLPGIFYEVEMSAEPASFAVAGAAIAGIPGVLSGRNKRLAWSITVTGAITAELRVERAQEAQNAAPQVTHTHSITVKGQSQPETLEVVWGEYGPLLANDLLPTQTEYQVSLEWTGHKGDEVNTLFALWKLNEAQSVTDLKAAAHFWGGPVLNLLWAEVEQLDGDYGWRVMGCVPQRTNPAQGVLPALSWEAGQWSEGYIPPTQLPEEIKPARGYIVSANHRMVPFDYPFVLSHEYMSSYRAERIEQLLKQAIEDAQAGKALYSVDRAASIQVDQTSPSLLDFREFILTMLSGSGVFADPVGKEVFLQLQLWDGRLAASSGAAAVLKVTEDYLYRLVAERLFTTAKAAEAWVGVAHTPLNPSLMAHWRMREVIFHFLSHHPAQFTLIAREEWPTLVQEAFGKALAELKSLQGPNPGFWEWGKLHQLEIVHPLVQVPSWQELPPAMRLLKRVFRLSRGPYQLGGDEHTIWQTSYHPVPSHAAHHPRRFWANAYQPSWRVIMTDQGRYYGCLPGGVSGHTRSRFSDNQLKNYLTGKLHMRSLERIDS